MSFYPHSDGDWEIRWMRKIASVALTANTLLAESAAVDTVEPAAAADTAVIGICLKTVTSSDDDYADNTRIPVLVPKNDSADFIGDITTGTIAITDEGNLIDLTDASGADADASTTDILKIKKFISTTKAVFSLNKPT